MKKGDALPQLIGGIIILMFVVYVTWSYVYGQSLPKVKTDSEEVEEMEMRCSVASMEEDCKNSIYGSYCLAVRDPNYPESVSYFCGCYLDEHCLPGAAPRGETCGNNNRCQ